MRSVARLTLALAVVALVGGTSLVSAPILRAAETGLRIVTQAQYTAVPANRRVHVAVDTRATNLTPDPPNGRYYYTDAHFAVQPTIRNLTAQMPNGATLAARVISSTKEFTEVDVAFGRGLFHGQTISFTFSFDIVDPGGVAQRDVRLAASLMAFPVWAFGSAATPGSSVSVLIPAGYSVSVAAGTLQSTSESNGSTLLAASSIPDAQTFFAYVTAEKPGAFKDTIVSVALPEATVKIRVRAWDDDPDWGKHVAGIETKGLPALRQLIGLDYQVRGQLIVEEAAGRRLGDYAGVYNTVTEIIDLRYDADDITPLHETAHTWFNDSLFTGRWIGEAWAEYYAVEAGKQIGVTGQIFTVTPELRAHKIPLNAWGAIGQESPEVEDYGYAATYRLAQLVAERAATAGLQRVWRAAKDAEASYQPAHATTPPERGISATVEGWQRLLDLLEERTGKSYTDLWKDWVVTSDERAELDQRNAARRDYSATVTAAGEWELPYQVRYEMGAWQFPQVEALLADARAVVSERDQIAASARQLNLQVPTTVKAAFETGKSFDLARSDADAELAALTAVQTASTATSSGPTPTEWVGLLFNDPSASISDARAAFERGDSMLAKTDAQQALTKRGDAADVGRLRVAIAGGSALALDALAMGVLSLRRRRRHGQAAQTDGVTLRWAGASPAEMPAIGAPSSDVSAEEMDRRA